MKLYVIFGQRTCSYEGEHAPEVLDCWDEYSVDENDEGYVAAVEKHKRRTLSDSSGLKPEFSAVEVIEVVVDTHMVSDILNKNPKVSGTIVSPA